jgi:general secretion pathway protein G
MHRRLARLRDRGWRVSSHRTLCASLPIPAHVHQPARSRFEFPRKATRAGFTLIELLMVVAIIGVLARIGSQKYGDYLERTKVAKAIGDIKAIQTDIDAFESENNRLPIDLGEIGRAGLLDPWENAYVYAPFPGGNPPGSARKDRSLVPINSTYDLYSSGPDGASVGPLTAARSRDDIVRANDGGFIGAARNF